MIDHDDIRDISRWIVFATERDRAFVLALLAHVAPDDYARGFVDGRIHAHRMTGLRTTDMLV